MAKASGSDRIPGPPDIITFTPAAEKKVAVFAVYFYLVYLAYI